MTWATWAEEPVAMPFVGEMVNPGSSSWLDTYGPGSPHHHADDMLALTHCADGDVIYNVVEGCAGMRAHRFVQRANKTTKKATMWRTSAPRGSLAHE
eukprot:1055074-Pyramimonas_sp.AAC.1